MHTRSLSLQFRQSHIGALKKQDGDPQSTTLFAVTVIWLQYPISCFCLHRHMSASHSLISSLSVQVGGLRALREKMLATEVVGQMDAPVLESWTREPKGFRSIDPIEKTARLMHSTRNVLPLQWLCGQLGGFFVLGPDAFLPMLGKGAQTWFVASLQLHELRRVVIQAFLDNREGHPSIDECEAKLMIKPLRRICAISERR